MREPESESLAVLSRLLAAVNGHDLEALVSCFSSGYVNETPAHPHRGFTGSTQVCSNWQQIFASVPDLQAEVPDPAVDGDRLWTEWRMWGSRLDCESFEMCGVVIFRVAAGVIVSARFYLEPVERGSGDVATHTRRVTGATAEVPA